MVSIQTNGFSFMWWGFCLFYTMQVNEILFSLLITLHQDIHRILYRTHRDQFSVELLSIKKRKNEIKMWPRVLWIIHSDGKDVLLSSALNVFFCFLFFKVVSMRTNVCNLSRWENWLTGVKTTKCDPLKTRFRATLTSHRFVRIGLENHNQ